MVFDTFDNVTNILDIFVALNTSSSELIGWLIVFSLWVILFIIFVSNNSTPKMAITGASFGGLIASIGLTTVGVISYGWGSVVLMGLCALGLFFSMWIKD